MSTALTWDDAEIGGMIAALECSASVAEACEKFTARYRWPISPNAMKHALRGRPPHKPPSAYLQPPEPAHVEAFADAERRMHMDAVRPPAPDQNGQVDPRVNRLGLVKLTGNPRADAITDPVVLVVHDGATDPSPAESDGTGRFGQAVAPVSDGHDHSPDAYQPSIRAVDTPAPEAVREPRTDTDTACRAFVDHEPEPHLAGTGDAGFGESWIRVILPDVHGAFRDLRACAAALADVKALAPREIVLLGDVVDCSGLYSAHPGNYTADIAYSYEDDVAGAGDFLDELDKAAPNASKVLLIGNHDQHVERWAARHMPNAKDAAAFVGRQSPGALLKLSERGYRVIERDRFYDGLSIRGTIQRGKCLFTHGSIVSKFATAGHLARFGMSTVHGHTHRSQSHVIRTVASSAIGAWCPGTLSQLQPLWRHTDPTDWTHGIGVQAVQRDGRFVHVNAPIVNGWSGLSALLATIRPVRSFG